MSDSQGTYVYIVDDKNHVVRRPVRVSGTIEAGAIIAEGLTGNERIVTTAGGFLRDGEAVRRVAARLETATDART